MLRYYLPVKKFSDKQNTTEGSLTKKILKNLDQK